ncbi:hypothetical protein PHLCEN_2v3755 [Hermanssonia centrifuga]|uniref:Aldose 1-epimerase n=1 Tax=Hermanssonia centrifuga TaxID=98765 RepID=A0A2R6QBF9_9APHY|nr:hypothetical protein PHLCEN_2v3755 [Hermanssonia centrifuga]
MGEFSAILSCAYDYPLTKDEPQPFDITTLVAPDGSITAKFVSFGATMTELWVKDKYGRPRDIILGYDDNTKLLTDPFHPVFNPIVGRNLDAFQGSDDILAHHLHIDSSRVVAVDGDAIPTGEFIDVAGTAYDFRTPERIDYRWNDTAGFCGGGCIGYDNCWIYDHNETSKPGISLWSDLSGIRLDVTTNNPATQVFTAYGLQLLNMSRKLVHGGPRLIYESSAGVAIEQEGYIDAINTPEWGVDQICTAGPGTRLRLVTRIESL